jgi:hypothetical protein
MKKSLLGTMALAAVLAIGVAAHANSQSKVVELNGICDFTSGNDSFGTCVIDPIIHECDTNLNDPSTGANPDCPR